jgi:hypothetical protein
MIPFPSEIVDVRKRGVIATSIGLAIGGVWYWSNWSKPDSALSFLRLRIGDLRGRVEEQRAASAEAVEKYQPTIAGRVDDLGRPVVDLLRQLPGVAEVQMVAANGKPTRRLIHLRDWHYVPRDLLDRWPGMPRPMSNSPPCKARWMTWKRSWRTTMNTPGNSPMRKLTTCDGYSSLPYFFSTTLMASGPVSLISGRSR